MVLAVLKFIPITSIIMDFEQIIFMHSYFFLISCTSE